MAGATSWMPTDYLPTLSRDETTLRFSQNHGWCVPAPSIVRCPCLQNGKLDWISSSMNWHRSSEYKNEASTSSNAQSHLSLGAEMGVNRPHHSSKFGVEEERQSLFLQTLPHVTRMPECLLLHHGQGLVERGLQESAVPHFRSAPRLCERP